MGTEHDSPILAGRGLIRAAFCLLCTEWSSHSFAVPGAVPHLPCIDPVMALLSALTKRSASECFMTESFRNLRVGRTLVFPQSKCLCATPLLLSAGTAEAVALLCPGIVVIV